MTFSTLASEAKIGYFRRVEVKKLNTPKNIIFILKLQLNLG